MTLKEAREIVNNPNMIPVRKITKAVETIIKSCKASANDKKKAREVIDLLPPYQN